MDLKVVLVAIVVLATGQWMLAAEMKMHALRLRRETRRCPSCGRLRRDCRCLS